MREETIDIIRSIWPELEALGVEHLDLFGSCARGEADARSDVDVVISFRATPTLRGLVDVRDLLEAALGTKVYVLTAGSVASRPRLAERVRGDLVRVA